MKLLHRCMSRCPRRTYLHCMTCNSLSLSLSHPAITYFSLSPSLLVSSCAALNALGLRCIPLARRLAGPVTYQKLLDLRPDLSPFDLFPLTGRNRLSESESVEGEVEGEGERERERERESYLTTSREEREN